MNETKDLKSKKKKKALNPQFNNQRWIEVNEHQPEVGRIVRCYSEVYGQYYLARFTPFSGWSTIGGNFLSYITHWCDEELYFPWKATCETNREVAKKYGFDYSED